MKTVAAAFIILALLTSCSPAAAAPVRTHSGTPEAPAPANPFPHHVIPPGQQVLIVGDSLTAGFGASQPSATGYAPLVTSALNVSTTAQVFGYPGDDSTQVHAALPHDALSAPHTLVVIETGTNDFNDMTLSQFADAYSALVNAATATLSPGGFLLCLTTWHSPTEVNQFGLTDAAYNDVIGSHCQLDHSVAGARTRVVDITSLYGVPGYHATSGDTFHPNDAGHMAIRDAVLGALFIVVNA
jgi:acyl-CoA thioesterase I